MKVLDREVEQIVVGEVEGEGSGVPDLQADLMRPGGFFDQVVSFPGGRGGHGEVDDAVNGCALPADRSEVFSDLA
ncbi:MULTISPECIES: hypothetical protein [unclassified Streptomyces]|uniref:hypothetical protein n=1 Tax=unclassified Streptomyces TaxID=2593676 RepID=UPI002DDAB93C|nr:hypothetical protein [Streptomyces sp. NBC_01762]WSC42612.1 hypothetical protein OIE61_00465 [Streptomyces sp. NBC_01762]WSC50241.1 hypothetical protein OIE61_44010 [Streptomyces sp. NBC_01762]